MLEIDAGELVVGADYADFDDFWWPFTAGVGGSGSYCASLDEAGREALREEVRRRLRLADGAVPPNGSRLVRTRNARHPSGK
jgi:hypothetical protein